MYKLKVNSETSLVHETTISSELWHRRLAHINYKAFPHVRKVVTGLPDMKIEHEGTYKDVHKERTSRIPFRKVTQRLKVHWN